jgi:hypothetical protein
MNGNGTTGKNRQDTRGDLFEVGFKGYYRETSEHFTEYVKANNQEMALSKFCRMKKISITTLQQIENVQWWEDEWLMSFRYVREVVSIPCLHCNGSGVTTRLPR